MMLIKKSSTGGSFISWVKGFPDNRLIEEISVLDKAIDDGSMKDSILFDAMLSLRDFLRDECVRRLAEKSQ